MWRLLRLISCAVVLAAAPAYAQNTPAPEGAKAYIVWPPDGEVITAGKLWVRMGLKNMGVAPAGVTNPNTGHHHLLVNTDPPPLDEEIPNDKNHLHFGGGQTEARLIDLPPGEYTLQLALGDAKHYPHNPPVFSEQITVVVPPR